MTLRLPVALIISLAWFSGPQLWATHYMGVDLAYECMPSATPGCSIYRIYVSIYYDCAGGATVPLPGPAPFPAIKFTASQAGCPLPTPQGGWAVVSYEEVTPVCPSYSTRCLSPTATLNGVTEARHYRDYRFCNLASGCDYTVSWDACCRNTAITSGANLQGMYVAAQIRPNLSPCNNSPRFSNLPVPYICAGQQFVFNQGAFDPDGDSLTYSLGMCQETPGGSVGYAPGYSPSTVYTGTGGVISSPLGSTWKVEIDPLTGDVVMTPVPGAQVTAVLCVQVNEYRNGTLINTVTRDIQVTVIACTGTNILPVISGVANPVGCTVNSPFKVIATASVPMSFQVPMTDPNSAQTFTLFWNQALASAGATFTSTGLSPVQTDTIVTNGTPPTGVFTWTPSACGIYTFMITARDNNCPVLGQSQRTFLIDVRPAPGTSPPVVPITTFWYPSSPVCTTGVNPVPAMAPGFFYGGVFTAPGGVSIDSLTGIVDLSASTPGQHTITYTVPASGCRGADTSTALLEIVTQIPPNITFSYPASPVCIMGANPAPVLGPGVPSGGVYSAPAGVSINPVTGVVNLAGIMPGTYTITYTSPPSPAYCWAAGSGTTQLQIVTQLPPNITFSYPASPVCVLGTNPAPVLGPGVPSGGVFSAPAGVSINPATGVVNLAASIPGVYTVAYASPPAPPLCWAAGNGTTLLEIVAPSPPNIVFSYPSSPVCALGGNPAPVLGAGVPSGGVFSAPAGVSINPATGVVNLAGSIPGIHPITYTSPVVPPLCKASGSGTTLLEIIAPSPPPANFVYPASPVCIAGANPMPQLGSGLAPGGAFSAPNGVSINASTGEVNLAGSTPGVYTIIYHAPASATLCLTAGGSMAVLEILPATLPATGFSYPSSPVCIVAGNPLPVLGPGVPSSGAFSGPFGINVSPSTGMVFLPTSTPGTHSIHYYTPPVVSSSVCQAGGNSTAVLEILPAYPPVISFSYPSSPVCQLGTDPAPLPATGFVTGGTFAAPAGVGIDPVTGVVNLAASTPGTYTISYTVPPSPALCRAGGTKTAQLKILPPTPPAIGFSYPSSVCLLGTNPIPSLVPGFVSGGVFAAPGGVSIHAVTGEVDLAASAPGTYSIVYSVPAAPALCRAGGSQSVLLKIVAPDPPAIGFSYPLPVCLLGADPVPSLTSGFQSGGIFSALGGLSLDPATGTADLTGSVPGIHPVTYTVPASPALCRTAGSHTAPLEILEPGPPVIPFSYPSPVCILGADPAPLIGPDFQAGGLFRTTSGLALDSLTGIADLAGSVAGVYLVEYQVNASAEFCRMAGSSTTVLEIAAAVPAVTAFSYASPVCAHAGSLLPLSAGGFATSGMFTGPAGLGLDPLTGAVQPTSSIPGTYTIDYAVGPSVEQCRLGGAGTASLTIEPTAYPVTTFAYPTPLCSDAADIIPGFAPGMTPGGTFSAPSGLVLDPVTGTVEISSSQSGGYTITYVTPEEGCRLSGSSSAPLEIVPTFVPVMDFSYPGPLCAVRSVANPVLISGFDQGGIFSGSDGLEVDGATGAIDLVRSAPGVYTVVYDASPLFCARNARKEMSVTLEPVEIPVTDFAYPDVLSCEDTLFLPELAPGFSPEGVFSSDSRLAINPATGEINREESALKSHTISYEVAGEGCRVPRGSSFEVLIPDCTCRIFLPNAFSPNDDDANRAYAPVLTCAVEAYTLKVFDRWGEEIFRSTDDAQGWDGTVRGEPAPEGVYVVTIEGIFPDGQPVREMTTVVLMR